MKKTIDAIHSFGKKISAGKSYKNSLKDACLKDKAQEPKTVKKPTNFTESKQNLINKQTVERINTVSRKKTSKPKSSNVYTANINNHL